jgi:hypothetical protein
VVSVAVFDGRDVDLDLVPILWRSDTSNLPYDECVHDDDAATGEHEEGDDEEDAFVHGMSMMTPAA